jgi:hypothetical protein
MFELRSTRNTRVDGHVSAHGMPNGARVVFCACGRTGWNGPHSQPASRYIQQRNRTYPQQIDRAALFAWARAHVLQTLVRAA